MSCNKRSYRDRLGALITLSKLSASRSPKRHESRVYHCPDCGKWHITSKPKRAQAKRKAGEKP